MKAKPSSDIRNRGKSIAITIFVIVGAMVLLMKLKPAQENSASIGLRNKIGGSPRQTEVDTGGVPHEPAESSPALLDDQVSPSTDLETFKLRIARAEKEPNLQERAGALRDLIFEMCKNGLTDEAFDITRNYDAGSVRDSMIIGFFNGQADTDPAVVINRMTQLDESGHGDDLFTAVHGYFRTLNPSQFREFINREDFGALASEMEARSKGKFQGELAAYFAGSMFVLPSDELAPYVTAAREMFSSGLIAHNDLVRIVASANNLSGIDKWKAFSDMEGPPNVQTAFYRDQVVNQMVAENPAEAISALVASEHDPENADLKRALEAWGQMEPRAALNWWTANQDELPGPKRDAVAAGFAQSAIDEGSREIAKEWAQLISDPEIKASLLKTIEPE